MATRIDEVPANLVISTTATAGTALTATLPLVANQFHYITGIEIIRYATAATTGGSTPVVITSTNLPGSLSWTTETATAVGVASKVVSWFPGVPIISSVVGTATTIVCPATTSVIWRINVLYYTA